MQRWCRDGTERWCREQANSCLVLIKPWFREILSVCLWYKRSSLWAIRNSLDLIPGLSQALNALAHELRHRLAVAGFAVPNLQICKTLGCAICVELDDLAGLKCEDYREIVTFRELQIAFSISGSNAIEPDLQSAFHGTSQFDDHHGWVV